MLSSFSKIFEKVLHKSIVEHLDKYEILNDSQYGFRKKRSTLHALLNATENIYEALLYIIYIDILRRELVLIDVFGREV